MIVKLAATRRRLRASCKALPQLIITLSVYTSSAAAQGTDSADCRTNPHLPRAREQYDELQFEEAARTLQRAIEYSNNCRSDLAEIYRLKAYVDAVLGEPERCHRDFEIFLNLNPTWTLPSNLAPKIRDCYEDGPHHTPELRIEHEAPKDVLPNTPVSLKVKVIDRLRLVDEVKVYFRRQGVKIFTVASARADDNVSIVIPALSLPPDPEGYKIEYFVRAVDRWDGVLAENGTTRDPLSFAVEAQSEGIGWWVWAAVGVGVLGVGLSIFLATRGDEEVTLEVNDRGLGG
ncbi:MAG: hypothetical protein HY791_04330 [Deltaproteobacteria bacterium]|nr:hypothetical protein [Deltaproteobacteria bacterium]